MLIIFYSAIGLQFILILIMNFFRFGYVVDTKDIEEGKQMNIFRVSDVDRIPDMEYLIHEMCQGDFGSSSKIFPAASSDSLETENLLEIASRFCETGVSN